MSDLYLQADLKSPLVLTATDPAKVELCSYEIPKSTGVLVPSWTSVPATTSFANNAVMSGNTVNINVTRMGKLQFGMVRVAFRISTTGAAFGAPLGAIGLRIADIEVWNFTGMLYKQDTEKLAGQVNMLPPAKKWAILQRAMVLGDATETPILGNAVFTTDYCTYVPVLLPSTTTTRNNWDLETLEPLIIKVKFTGLKQLGFIAGVHTLTSLGQGHDADFITQTVDYEPEYKQALYLSNFGTEGLNMPYFSYDSETQLTTLTGATSTRIKLASTVPAFLTHCSVRTLVPTANGIPANLNLTQIDVYLNNRSFIQNIPLQAVTMKAEWSGSANIVISDTLGYLILDTNKVDTFSWSDRPFDRTSFSGALAYGGINLPEFVFFYPTQGGNFALLEAVIVNEFCCELLMNGKSGRLYRSTAS